MNHTLMLLSFLLCCCSTPGSKVVKQVLSLSFSVCETHQVSNLRWDEYEDIFSESNVWQCFLSFPPWIVQCAPLVDHKASSQSIATPWFIKWESGQAFCLLPYLRNCSVCLQTLFVSFFKCTRVVFFILFVSQETCLNLLKKSSWCCFGKRLTKSSVDHVDFSPFHIAKSK